MSPSPDVRTAREWLRETDRIFAAALDRLGDDALGESSLLPGWTRKHVLAHVHHNALAVGRLVTWAATGVEHPMYPDPERRRQHVEDDARLPAGQLRAMATASVRALDAALASLDDTGWGRPVQTVTGQWVPASDLPYLRIRELGVHTVDLDAGVGFADLPDGFVRTLVQDVVERRLAQDHGAGLAAWLTGREGAAPELGPWI